MATVGALLRCLMIFIMDERLCAKDSRETLRQRPRRHLE